MYLTSRRLFRTHGAQGGFTLLEVLIALVILGFGFLGAGKLLITSVKANDSAYMRTVANELAYSMLETLRTNRAAVLAGDYLYLLPTQNPIVSATTALPGAAVPNTSAGCYAASSLTDPQSLANCDIVQWQYQLYTRLPAGNGGIVTTAAGSVTIRVQWDETRAQCAMQSQSTCTTSGPTTTGGITLTSMIQ